MAYDSNGALETKKDPSGRVAIIGFFKASKISRQKIRPTREPAAMAISERMRRVFSSTRWLIRVACSLFFIVRLVIVAGLNFFFHIVYLIANLSHKTPQTRGKAREFFRFDEEKGDKSDHHHFAAADVEHMTYIVQGRWFIKCHSRVGSMACVKITCIYLILIEILLTSETNRRTQTENNLCLF